MVRRDLSIALETGAEIVIQHISAAEAVELVRQAKKKSTKIHAEATPHHFTLTEDAVMEHGTMAKMNPPLRTEADRQAIIRGLQDGTIDLIATDHARMRIMKSEAPDGSAQRNHRIGNVSGARQRGARRYRGTYDDAAADLYDH